MAVVAGGGYAWIGSPRLLPVTPDAPPGPGPSAEAQVAELQYRAEQHPAEAAGWLQAARANAMLNHGQAAVDDYRKAVALRPNDAELLADLADMLADQQRWPPGRRADPAGRARAGHRPNHVKALALKGSWR
jgi:cytochrome c-type biogenesis protein CcmH